MRFKQKAAQRKIKAARIVRLKQRKIRLGIAASFLCMTCFVWIYISEFRSSKIDIKTENDVKITTLPDGSTVTLNKSSSFEYPSVFTGNQRQVILKSGEAFFSVSHNKAKPFVIFSENTVIRVVGTSFNVKNRKGALEVIVETGIVEVFKDGNSVTLRAGEKVSTSINSKNLRKENVSDKLYNYYRSKEFIAEDTPLWRIVQALNEAYDVHIIIENKQISNLPLNTTFKNESLDKILGIISKTFKITVEKKQGYIILK